MSVFFSVMAFIALAGEGKNDHYVGLLFLIAAVLAHYVKSKK